MLDHDLCNLPYLKHVREPDRHDDCLFQCLLRHVEARHVTPMVRWGMVGENFGGHYRGKTVQVVGCVKIKQLNNILPSRLSGFE